MRDLFAAEQQLVETYKFADISRLDICAYEYEDREELRKNVKFIFPIGMSLSDFLKQIQRQVGSEKLGVTMTECGDDCTFVKDSIKKIFNVVVDDPEVIIDNHIIIGTRITSWDKHPIISGKSVSFLHKCKISNNNINIWEIAAHINNNKYIDRLDLIIFFEDENFALREINIDHDFFYDPNYIMKALKSIITYSSNNIKEFYNYIIKCGYEAVEHTNASGERWYTISKNNDAFYKEMQNYIKNTTTQIEAENIEFTYIPSLIRYLLLINPDYKYNFTARVFFDETERIIKLKVGDLEEMIY